MWPLVLAEGMAQQAGQVRPRQVVQHRGTTEPVSHPQPLSTDGALLHQGSLGLFLSSLVFSTWPCAGPCVCPTIPMA